MNTSLTVPLTSPADGPGRLPPFLSHRQRLGFLAGSVGIGAFVAFNNFTLPLWLSGFTSSYLLLALLGSTRTFEGAVVSPLAGSLSDHTWLGWLGRRRPFILVGGLTSASLLAVTPMISRLQFPFDLAWFPDSSTAVAWPIVVILLFTVAFNAMDDIHRALLADLTTPEERSKLSALAVILEQVGQAGLLTLGFLWWADRVPDEAFLVAAGVLALAVFVVVVTVREPEPAVWREDRAEPENNSSHGHTGLLADLRQYRPALVLCFVMFCYWSGVNAVMPLLAVYVRDILGGTVGQAQLLPALMLLSTMFMAVPVGLLGDYFGKRRVMAAGTFLLVSAALSGLFITTPAQGAVTFVVGGAGNAAIVVLTIPLLSELVPRHHMGVATGALAASASIAAPLSAFLAGALADLSGPRAIFALMAGMVTGAMLLLPQTRLSASLTTDAAGVSASTPG